MTDVSRIYLMDDHEIVARGISALLDLQSDLEVVGIGLSCAEARRDVEALRPDVAVLDIRLPDGNGLDVCREFHEKYPAMPSLIFTAQLDESALLQAITCGAQGFVLKQIREDSLVQAIRAVAAGNAMIDPVLTSRVMFRIRHEFDASGPLSGLTEREVELVRLVGEGKSNREIAGEMFLSEQTVKNYVSKILTKLGMERRTQLAALAQAG